MPYSPQRSDEETFPRVFPSTPDVEHRIAHHILDVNILPYTLLLKETARLLKEIRYRPRNPVSDLEIGYPTQNNMLQA